MAQATSSRSAAEAHDYETCRLVQRVTFDLAMKTAPIVTIGLECPRRAAISWRGSRPRLGSHSIQPGRTRPAS
jgi:hypothetical protein